MTRRIDWLLRPLLPLLAGTLLPLSLAPFDVWIAAPLSAALFAALLHGQLIRSGFWTGWLFGLGLFGSGASWVYVSINVYGHAPPWLAATLTALFCAGLALLSGLQGHLYRRWFAPFGWSGCCFAFPALWVLFEWLRSWLLTGFPWLYAGYAVIDTPFAGWVPVVGVFGASLWLTALGSTACALSLAWPKTRKPIALGLVALVCLGALGSLLPTHLWTQPEGKTLSVALYQPNINLEDKWNRRYFQRHLAQFSDASAPLYEQVDVLLWPESALPAYRHRLGAYLGNQDALAKRTKTTLITGIPVYADSGRHNSIVALGAGAGEHHKQKLVPFGEYVPLEQWLRGLIAFFDLPMSQFVPGPNRRPSLQVGSVEAAPFICYEIVYPDYVTRQSAHAGFLITVSNDSWFGDSIGPLQHLQMARFRALETARPLLRGTNNGVSAIVTADGRIAAQSEQFVEATLLGAITPRQGSTPIMRYGSTPVLVLSSVILLAFTRRRRH